MPLISITGGARDYGIKTLFKKLDLYINKKERLGLIGPNGSGKSTLLKIIAGDEELIEGKRICSSSLRISLVKQECFFDNNSTVLEEVVKGCGLKSDLLLKFKALSKEVADNPKEKRFRPFCNLIKIRLIVYICSQLVINSWVVIVTFQLKLSV